MIHAADLRGEFAMPLLAQEDFTGLWQLILVVFIVLVVLAVAGIIATAHRRWFGFLLIAPGMLISFVMTVAFLKAFASQQDIHWSILPFLLFPAPLLLGIVAIVAWGARRKDQA
jgi:hypothetical protein